MWRLKEAQLHETVRANRREDLQELENSLNYLRKEVLVLQNKSVSLDATILAEKDREFEQSSLLKNLSVETETLKYEIDKFLVITSKLQMNLQILSADLASIENRFENLNEAVSSGLYLQDTELKIQNLTEEWRNALTFLAAEIEELKQQTTQSHDTTLWNKEDGEEDIDSDLSRLRIGGLKNTPCRLPNITDSHIQVTSKSDDEGYEHLVFSCRPIGMYTLIQPPVPWRCVGGTWQGSFPTCRRLLNEVEVNELTNHVNKEFRCSDTEVPDPTDCAFFFKCSHGKADRMKCPANLHFDSNKRRCEYPINARCSSVLLAGAIETLQTLTPAIWIGRPNISQNHILDQQFSLMGTSSAGELVVYPRTTFTLQCLFPESVWGTASWYVRYRDSDSSIMMSNVQTRKSHVDVTLTAAKEEHSGTYTCRTPFGVEHSIVVNITAVQCPEINFEDVKYIRFPDSEDRILSTVARFPCDKDFSAMCLPNGSWSRGPPTSEECAHETEKMDDETKWRCSPIDTKDRPGLILDEDVKQNIVKFKCSSNLILDGEA
ncbi:Locomotion-related protein Hikaru genki, partial [Stegodyphus mimosarum]